MVPSSNGINLPPGFVSNLQNNRLDTGNCVARYPGLKLSDLPAGECVGTFLYASVLYVAMAAAGVVKIYYSTNLSTYTEITPALTKFTWVSGDRVTFCAVKDAPYYTEAQQERTFVIAQSTDYTQAPIHITSGFAASRVYQPSNPNTQTGAFGLPGVSWTARNPLAIRNPTGAYGIAATSANFTLGSAGVGGTTLHLTLAVAVAAAVGDTTTVTYGAGDAKNFSGNQILFWVEDNNADPWVSKTQFELYDGTNYIVVYNPLVNSTGTTTASDAYVLDYGTTGTTLRQIVFSKPTSSTFDFTNIRGFRLTWKGPTAPAAPIAISIYGCASGGGVQWGASYAMAFGNSTTNCVGPSTVVADNKGDSLYSLNMAQAVAAYKCQPSDLVFYDYKTYCPGPSSADITGGVNESFLYRQDNGQVGNYFFIKYTNVSATLGQFYTDTGAVQDPTHPAPDASIVVIPSGPIMANSNGRFFVGNADRMWFSQYGVPQYFRRVVKYTDPTTQDVKSPGSFNIAGESFKTVVPLGAMNTTAEDLGAPDNNAQMLSILTDQGLYRVSGFDAVSLTKAVLVAPHGTLAPYSPGVLQNGFFWLSTDLQVWFTDGNGVQNLSYNIVDTITRATPSTSVKDVHGACMDNRYYISCGSTPVLLIYNNINKAWESQDTIDATATTLRGLLVYPSSSAVNSLIYTTDSVNVTEALWQHEYLSSSGTLAFAVTGANLSAGYRRRVRVGQCQVTCDGYTGGTGTVTRVNVIPGSGATGTGTFSLGTTGTIQYVYDTSGVGLASAQVKVTVSASVPGGWKLYGADVKVTPLAAGGNR